MSVCKTCGCYLRRTNKTGYCREDKPRVHPPVRRCGECDSLLGKGNKSGLCAAHYMKRRSDVSASVDRNITDALLSGKSRQTVAEEFDVGINRVRKVHEFMPARLPTRRLAAILAAAARCADVTLAEITGKSRFRRFMLPRQAVCLLGMEAGHSSTQVAGMLNRDHSTVIHGREAARELERRSPAFADYLDRVRADDTPAPIEVAVEAALTAPIEPAPPPAGRVSAPKHPLAPMKPFELKRTCQPKNDFDASCDPDESHKFHRNIAAGSRALRIAIERARAA